MAISSSDFTEAQLISRLQEIFVSTDSRIMVGIGDDAAVVQSSGNQIITTDMAVAGVHFRKDWSSAFEIGRKVTAANTADVLAMSGTCDFLLVAMALTKAENFEWIEDVAHGIKFEADLAGAHVIGGDLSRSDQVVISITALGNTQQVISRSGAKVGDQVFLSSLTGWSAAGLEIFTRGQSPIGTGQEKAIAEFKTPTIDYGYDTSNATALCDVSDALVIQAEQMARASNVAMRFDLAKIKAAVEFQELAKVASELDVDLWNWIFGGGEDHVLLATGSNLAGICIGQIEAGSGVHGVPAGLELTTWHHFQ